MDNQTIRKSILEKRKALDDDTVKRKSADVTKRCVSYCEHAKTIGIYLPILQEVQLMTLYKQRKSLQHYGVPRIITDGQMEFVELSEHSLMRTSSLGVLEPIQGKVYAPMDFDVIFVPVVAFRQDGMRIGYGKGYYDRYLKQTKAFTIGVAYEFQRCEEIIVHAHDVKLDMIITDQTIYYGD